MLLWRVAGLALFGALLSAGGWAQSPPPPRKLMLEDFYRLREVSGPELSPEGAWVAYTVSRPDSAKEVPGHGHTARQPSW